MEDPPDNARESDPMLRQAMAWLLRLKRGKATVADATEFRRWRNESPEHQRALRRAYELWRQRSAGKNIAAKNIKA